ncbi:citryl-CoA lyase [Photobacterium gaetbulicola]|uniref:citrate synthase (unknown stereospecificity) n=1 Tax=Photobacterium gaetbulicola Gung47 TaxID=658445 RepID=A0A0C5W249_9GAMM|nr:citryl-CoA lyase [Photobacterium gaetbulicola]AJR05466.1 citrate synthase [Photobacterium gaetbulicola Gung47]PSU12784.1 citryl-CoA lyase [Photobacterium gaetbulicola]
MSIERPEHGIGRDVSDWWKTSIIEMSPGEIRYYGYPIEELIGNVSFAQMIWLMVRGDLPSPSQAKLLDAALMSAVDHGPQAPSIAIARMAATCGVGLNNAMASAVNVLGDVHGGAGEQAVALYRAIADRCEQGESLEAAIDSEVTTHKELHGKFIPGFGHRFHPVDPRAPALMALIKQAADAGTVTGRFAEIAMGVECYLFRQKGKRIPMNIDGATAVIYAELGFPAPLARGLFCLSRSVGILAHAWEQTGQGGRNKGPIPRNLLWSYDGPEQREWQKAPK